MDSLRRSQAIPDAVPLLHITPARLRMRPPGVSMPCPCPISSHLWWVCLPFTGRVLDGITANAHITTSTFWSPSVLTAWLHVSDDKKIPAMAHTDCSHMPDVLSDGRKWLLTGHAHAGEIVHEQSDHIDNDDCQQRARIKNHLRYTAVPQHAHCGYRVTLLMECVTSLG